MDINQKTLNEVAEAFVNAGYKVKYDYSSISVVLPLFSRILIKNTLNGITFTPMFGMMHWIATLIFELIILVLFYLYVYQNMSEQQQHGMFILLIVGIGWDISRVYILQKSMKELTEIIKIRFPDLYNQ